MVGITGILGIKFHPEFPRFTARKFHPSNQPKMAPQILQWTTAECVEFLCKCAKQYAAIISDEDLDIYVKNFEKNHVAGSTILNFSDSQWNALIPSLGFGNFVRQQLQAKDSEKSCLQEMRTALWNSSRKKTPAEQSKPTMKDMPSRLTITSFFQRKEQKPVINDGSDIPEDTVLTDTVISSEVGGLSESKVIMTASNVENFLAQLGKNQTGHSTLLIRKACLELCALLQNNKTDTARRMMRLCPDAFASDESCRMSLTKFAAELHVNVITQQMCEPNMA